MAAITGTILVTPEALIEKSSEFASKGNEVQTLHGEMMTKVNSLMGTFEGQAASAYQSKFSALQSSMETIFRMIQEHSSDLSQMAETYRTGEASAQSEIDSLPSGNLG